MFHLVSKVRARSSRAPFLLYICSEYIAPVDICTESLNFRRRVSGPPVFPSVIKRDPSNFCSNEGVKMLEGPSSVGDALNLPFILSESTARTNVTHSGRHLSADGNDVRSVDQSDNERVMAFLVVSI